MLRQSQVSKISYFLLITIAIGLLGNITQIGLQGGYGYIGSGDTNKVLDIAITCSHTYINNKYDLPLLNKQILSTLILCCISAVCLIIMMVILITFVLQIYSLNSKVQDQYCRSITHFKVKLLYIMCSISLICGVIYFSKYLGFYLQGPSECKQSIYKNQWIYIMSLGMLSFFVIFISWFIILILNSKIITYLDDNEVLFFKKQQDQSKRDVELENSQEKKSIQKLINPNITQEAFKQQEYIVNIIDNKNKSYQKQNQLFKVQQKQFDKNSNYLKPKPDFIHDNTPKSSIKTPTFVEPKKSNYSPYFQSHNKNLDERPKKQYEQKINQQPINFYQQKKNLHTNYFKGDQEIKKPNYFSNSNTNQKKQQLKTPKKRGMLMDYIRGKYAD